MNLFIVTPIYRKKFQQPIFCFSNNSYKVGSLVFVSIKNNARPAIVIKTESLKDSKSFLRKNKIKLEKISNEKEIELFSKETIDIINKINLKLKTGTETIFPKILKKETVEKISSLKPEKKYGSEITSVKDITPEYVIKQVVLQPKEEKQTSYGVQSIGSIIKTPKKENKSLHSEKHYLVNEIRNYFGETSKKGPGSFSFYLGFFKNIPKNVIYQYWAEVKQIKKPIQNQQKIFWWKIGQYMKNKK